MKKVIIAEKPSVARIIAEAIGKVQVKNGYYLSNGWIVSYAHGHIIQLAMPKAYGVTKWDVSSLPIIPSSFKTVITDRKRFSTLRSLIEDADIVVNACDAGREGELIFREIIEKVKLKHNVQIKRMWLSSLTKQAVIKEINNLKEHSNYDNLGKSAKAREIADWLVGINATRAFTIKSNALFTIGRVQTPTLKAIIDRERQRAQETDKYFYEVIGVFHSVEYQGTLIHDKILDENIAKQIVSGIAVGQKGSVEDYHDSVVPVKPYLLYDLTTLQRDANKTAHLSAKRTLDIVQSLYEKKLVSYPRTDSKYLPTDMKQEVQNIAQQIAPLFNVIPDTFRPSILNDAKITDHYALIPLSLPTSDLSKEEMFVYSLIARRFLAVFIHDAQQQRQKFVTRVNDMFFSTYQTALIDPGWQVVYGRKKEDTLPDLRGMHTLKDVYYNKKKEPKTPPFTDASLLKFMEHAGKYGLGTPATRAGIIERLIKTKYVKRSKNVIVPEDKGYKLIEALEKLKVNELLSADLTSQFEHALELIKDGKIKDKEFIDAIGKYATHIVNKILHSVRKDGAVDVAN